MVPLYKQFPILPKLWCVVTSKANPSYIGAQRGAIAVPNLPSPCQLWGINLLNNAIIAGNMRTKIMDERHQNYHSLFLQYLKEWYTHIRYMIWVCHHIPIESIAASRSLEIFYDDSKMNCQYLPHNIKQNWASCEYRPYLSNAVFTQEVRLDPSLYLLKDMWKLCSYVARQVIVEWWILPVLYKIKNVNWLYKTGNEIPSFEYCCSHLGNTPKYTDSEAIIMLQ